MDEVTRLRMRRAHANHAYHCTCGKTVHGNGGRAGHEYMHVQRGDGHYWLTYSAWLARQAHIDSSETCPAS